MDYTHTFKKVKNSLRNPRTQHIRKPRFVDRTNNNIVEGLQGSIHTCISVIVRRRRRRRAHIKKQRRNKMKLKKEFWELLDTLPNLSAEWIVTSTPFGCSEGYSKVYLRRKKIPKVWQPPHPTLRPRLVISECVPNTEAEQLKKQARTILQKELTK